MILITQFYYILVLLTDIAGGFIREKADIHNFRTSISYTTLLSD